MKTNQSKIENINKLGIRITLILLIPVVVLSTMLMFEGRALNYGNITTELEDVFGENMILGVHDMDDGLISSVVFIDGAYKNEATYSDALVKTREFAKRMSKYKIKDIKEIEVIIGLKHNVDGNDILAYINIEPQQLKEVEWDNVNSYDDLSRYLKINLQ